MFAIQRLISSGFGGTTSLKYPSCSILEFRVCGHVKGVRCHTVLPDHFNRVAGHYRDLHSHLCLSDSGTWSSTRVDVETTKSLGGFDFLHFLGSGLIQTD